MHLKSLICIFFGYGAALWFSILAIQKRRLLYRARFWPSIRGRILESAVFKASDGQNSSFRVRYEYSLGQRFEAATPRIAGDWFFTDRAQAAFVARYAPGSDVEVFYDPNAPQMSCLDRTDTSGVSVMWILALGGALLASLLVWLSR